ncbi:MAG: FkbH-like protein [Erysipelotrichaceae bacterium]|nr:MAG: FkbH-like [Erysipelotrichaceae bacterium]TXT17759.1 MAG: FkbH-like protein [Erysipelotrichaceae bacterium]
MYDPASEYVLPLENVLDQLEVNVSYSRTYFLNKLNQELMLNKPKQVHLIDENGLSNEIGKSRWFDPTNAFLNKAPYAYEWLPITVDAYVRKIIALRGFYHKVLVLDLDNTLWGGVIGDDGVEGINLDPNHAVGEAYLAFQKYVLQLKDKGVMLAVCSKNEEAAAREGFTHPNMLIKLSDIACFMANWNDKASNLKIIAETLNIKTDTLVFFDDNPAEREIIKQFLKEVTVIDVPEDPSTYVNALYQAHTFDWPQITREDLLRIKAVEDDTQREILKTQFVDYDAYLDSLQMNAQAGKIGSAQIERFVQLTNKSNQFNLRTQRYTESDVIHRMNDEDYACIYIDLSDRFSPYGIIVCIVLKKSGKTAFIENWVMSCRVLNRGVETFALNLLIEQAKAWDCSELMGEYIPSAKNAMVKEHYIKMGFDQIQEFTYRLDGEHFLIHPTHIAVKEAK